MDYIKELNAIQSDSSYIPENCNNIFDFGIYTNRAIMDVYNESSLSLLQDQFTIFDGIVNESIIYEDAKSKLKDMKDKVIGALKAFWEKIKGFFEKILKFITNIFKSMQTEVFSIATKEEFKKAVDYFKNHYNKSVIYFTKETEKSEDHSNVFLRRGDFIDSCNKYNNYILDRATGAFKYLEGIYTKANSINPKAISAWISGDVKNREDIIRELKNTKSSQIYAYIIYGNDDAVDGTFGKEELENAIYDKLSENKNNGNSITITSDNIVGYAPVIISNVYNDSAQKWTGFIKNAYDEAKNMINEAIKGATYIFSTDDIHNDFVKDVNQNVDKVLGQGTIGPKYAVDYCNRCKDVLQVLITIESVMNNIISTGYKANVKIVCSVINKYWKLTGEKKQVVSSLKTQPA